MSSSSDGHGPYSDVDPWAEFAEKRDLLEKIAGDGGPWSEAAAVIVHELDERGYQ